MLKLSEAVPASTAQPIPIVAATDTRDETLGKRTTAAGWGSPAGRRELSPDLQQISTTIIIDATRDVWYSDRDIDDAAIQRTGSMGSSRRQRPGTHRPQEPRSALG